MRRERGRLEITQHGTDLLERVRPVLSAISKVTGDTQEAPEIAWMSLGAFESFASKYVPDLIARLQIKCPGIRLTLRVARSGALAVQVRKGDLCMAIIRDLDEMGRLEVVPLGEDRLGFWAAKTHPITAEGASALGEHDVGVLSPDLDGHPRYHVRLLDAAGFRSHPTFVSDSYESLKAAAARGSIIALLPASVARGSGLVELPLPEESARLGVHRICMISKPGCDPRENAFLEAELRSLLSADAQGDGSKSCSRPTV
jgi:DNA-binding transcriptional LysR family regulator